MKIKLTAKDSKSALNSILTVKAADPRISNTLKFNIIRSKVPKLIWTDSTGSKNLGTEASATITLKDDLVTAIYFTFEDLTGTMPGLNKFDIVATNSSGVNEAVGGMLLERAIQVILTPSKADVYNIRVSYGEQTIVFVLTVEASSVEPEPEPELPSWWEEGAKDAKIISLQLAVPSEYWRDGISKELLNLPDRNYLITEGDYYKGTNSENYNNLVEVPSSIMTAFYAAGNEYYSFRGTPPTYIYIVNKDSINGNSDDIPYDQEGVQGMLYMDRGTKVGRIEPFLEPSSDNYGEITITGQGTILAPQGENIELTEGDWYTYGGGVQTSYYKVVLNTNGTKRLELQGTIETNKIRTLWQNN